MLPFNFHNMLTLTFHISPSGNDAWSGRYETPNPDGTDGPWATLAGARDALRAQRTDPELACKSITVVIQKGRHELSETLVFETADGGSADAPVRYIAAEGAAPVISGGRRITQWSETEHCGKRCWVADLPDVASGEWKFNRLFVNHSPRPRPRLPLQGFYHFTGVDGLPDSGFSWHQGPDRANFAPGEIANWRNLQDVEIKCYQLWFEIHHRIEAVDEEKHLVHFAAPSMGSLRDERGEFARYMVENVFEAFEDPGQWYLDRREGKLYYLPFDHETLATTEIIAPRLEELLRLKGQVGHLHFENLTFAHQTWEPPRECVGYIQAAFGVPGAVVLDGAHECVFYGCGIRHISGYGFEVLAGSHDNTLAACVIADAGAGGIKVGHEGLKPHHPGTVGENFQPPHPIPPIATTVVDCHIRDCGHLFPSAIGIWVGNSGWNRLLHNEISDCNYTGISCGWTWGYAPTRTVANQIENNWIHHINHRELLSDNGGIYTLGRQPGTVLRGNVIHDIACYGYGAWGIYPDEGSSEMRIEHNLVCGTRKAALFIHYGRDLLIEQNVFALSDADHFGLGKRELHRSAVLRQNIFLPRNGQLTGQWDPASFTAEKNLLHALDGSKPTFAGLDSADLAEQGQGKGTILTDPLFVDAEGRDFTLRADSPAKAIGFKPWKWENAGPRPKGSLPRDFAAYLKRHPLPAKELPVVTVRIEPRRSSQEARTAKAAEFEVIIANIGTAPASGGLRLIAGPRKSVHSPTLRRLSYSLAPGEETRETVTVPIRPRAGTFWLETEPADKLTVPTRATLFDPSMTEWFAPWIPGVRDAATLRAGLAHVPGRKVLQGKRLAADVCIAASEAGLLMHAHYVQEELRPMPNAPWTGTGIELIAYKPHPEGAPVGTPAPMRQVFLIPGKSGIDVRKFNASGVGTEPLTAASVHCERIDGGWLISAVIPWTEFGFAECPDAFRFDLIVDVTESPGGPIRQISAFDLPFDGWSRLAGTLIVKGK